MSDAPFGGRPRPPWVGDERATLDGWLEFHRATLLWKCEGLTHEQLKQRAVPTSGLSLLGLVRHMTEVERGWFLGFLALAGEGSGRIYSSPENPDGDFDDVDAADPETDLARYRAEVDGIRAKIVGHDLDELELDDDPVYSLRWIYTHMIEEYARHNGHADLIREAIDGSVGD